MENLLDRLSSYNLLNNLLPGVLFLVLIDVLEIAYINESNILLMLFGGYFAGMVLSRIGSVVIEPWFKWWKIVRYAKYEDFLKAEVKDVKMPTLLSESNMFRTFVAMFLLLLLLYGVCLFPSTKEWLRTPSAIIVMLVLLLILFTVSYRKQSTYIRKHVENTTKK
jgi:hypothetical protein